MEKEVKNKDIIIGLRKEPELLKGKKQSLSPQQYLKKKKKRQLLKFLWSSASFSDSYITLLYSNFMLLYNIYVLWHYYPKTVETRNK